MTILPYISNGLEKTETLDTTSVAVPARAAPDHRLDVSALKKMIDAQEP